jgi:hypothetical protein
MPGGSFSLIGNNLFQQTLYASIKPATSVSTDSSTTSTYTIQGLLPGDLIDLYPQSSLATSTTYLTVGAVWVSAPNTLSIQWVNSTSATSSSTPTAVNTAIGVCRPEAIAGGVTTYPQALE